MRKTEMNEGAVVPGEQKAAARTIVETTGTGIETAVAESKTISSGAGGVLAVIAFPDCSFTFEALPWAQHE